MTDALLEVDGVDVTYQTKNGDVHAVNDASFSLGSNEYFGLVGESGSGKSTLAKSIFGGLDPNGRVTSGTIRYKGQEIQDFSEKELNQQIRWKEVAVVPQAAMNSLDPLMKISDQAIELANTHTEWSEERAVTQLEELFEVVGIPESRINDYPHQFSGGMKQRAIIALTLLLEPSLIIADEPTTALDVIMQDQILEYITELREERDLSLLFITHDISVIFETCDTVGVMHGGQIAEIGTTSDILNKPRHPYTILLQQAFPDIRFPDRELEVIEGTPPSPGGEVDYCTFASRCPWAEPECRDGAPPLTEHPDDDGHRIACIRSDEMSELASEHLGVPDASSDASGERAQRGTEGQPSAKSDPVLELRDLSKQFDPSANIVEAIKARLSGTTRSRIRAVDGVDLQLEQNQVQGVIGESGCGKSTLLMTLMGQYEPTSGEILIDGTPRSEFDKADWKEFRRRVQIIYQDPFEAINPKYTVRSAVREPLKIHGMDRHEERILRALEQVELNPPEKYIDRRESQLSGGEKQRVAIARALVLEPDVILADEPVSMLDVSTQAAILRLLNDLTSEYDVSMFYVSHDLSTVSYICDTVNVMYLGRIIESAPAKEIIHNPKHPYTQALIQAIPIPDPAHERQGVQLRGTPGDASEMPSGCRFKDRCPERMDVCDRRPVFEALDDDPGHDVACHLYSDVGAATSSSEGRIADGGMND